MIHEIRNRSAGGGPVTIVQIETGRLVNHPSKVVARLHEPGADRGWKGPWKDEETAIRSICQIYSIGGP